MLRSVNSANGNGFFVLLAACVVTFSPPVENLLRNVMATTISPFEAPPRDLVDTAHPRAIGIDLLFDQPTETDKDCAWRRSSMRRKIPLLWHLDQEKTISRTSRGAPTNDRAPVADRHPVAALFGTRRSLHLDLPEHAVCRHVPAPWWSCRDDALGPAIDRFFLSAFLLSTPVRPLAIIGALVSGRRCPAGFNPQCGARRHRHRSRFGGLLHGVGHYLGA